jgi:hypothetical protein
MWRVALERLRAAQDRERGESDPGDRLRAALGSQAVQKRPESTVALGLATVGRKLRGRGPRLLVERAFTAQAEPF